jgi:hypothetical protein
LLGVCESTESEILAWLWDEFSTSTAFFLSVERVADMKKGLSPDKYSKNFKGEALRKQGGIEC